MCAGVSECHVPYVLYVWVIGVGGGACLPWCPSVHRLCRSDSLCSIWHEEGNSLVLICATSILARAMMDTILVLAQ